MPKHLIIDGHNTLLGIDSLRKCFNINPEKAIETLTNWARAIHDIEAYQVTLVFDGRRNEMTIEHPGGSDSFTVIYSSHELSADGVIERMISRSNQPKSLMIATNDRMVRDVGIGRGCDVMGIKTLESMHEAAEKKSAQIMQNRSRSSDKEWGNRIPL